MRQYPQGLKGRNIPAQGCSRSERCTCCSGFALGSEAELISALKGRNKGPTPTLHAPRSTLHAFSLLEMMVAVTLLLIIISALLAMFYQTQRAFRLSSTQQDILEGGRAGMERFTSELPEITPCNRPFLVNLSAQTMFYPFLIQPRTVIPNAAPRSNVIQDIFFLRQHNDQWIGTGYFVPPLSPGSPDPIGSLYRFEQTVANVTNDLQISNLFVNFVKASQENPPTSSHRVMDRVINLRLTPYDGQGLLMSNTITATPIYDQFTYSFTNIFTNLPAYLDLELGILEPRAFEKYKALRDVAPTKALQYLVNHVEKVHLFRQRIPIRTGQ